MDPLVANGISALILSSAQAGAALTWMADRNLSQGLGVIHNTLIQGNATPQQFGAERTSIHIPSSDGIGTALPK